MSRPEDIPEWAWEKAQRVYNDMDPEGAMRTNPMPVIARAIAQAVAEEREAEGWQDIATAPRDGTTILAYNAFMGQYTTCFTTMWVDGSPDYEGFPCGFVNGMFGAWDCQPSHWKPLGSSPVVDRSGS